MAVNQTHSLLRMYLSSTDKEADNPIYENIVKMANENNIAGATVLKGVLGYKSKDSDNSLEINEQKEKFPIVIEIVDKNEKIISFYEKVKSKFDSMTKGCLITIESIDVLFYK